LVVILLLGFGYTQTSSFRNWLKDLVIEQVNLSTNGKLHIEKIDGTLFTSLFLVNTVYTLEEDTIFSAEKIEIKFSPLRIFLKTIYFRKLEIDNANIFLIKEEDGELNISKIMTPTLEEVEDTVSISEPFNWKIDVADLKLKNINFRHQLRKNIHSNAFYPQPEMDDFRLENINLSLSAIADIEANEYSLRISEFELKPNLSGFVLKNLSGNFVLADNIAGVTGLNIETERSDILVNAGVSDFSPFGSKEFNLENSPVKVELNASQFNFDDLTNFISGTDLLKGTVETHVEAEGTFNELKLNKLIVKFNETDLEAEGKLENVLGGTDMVINARFNNSLVNQNDIKTLLPEVSIPIYKEYGILQFDTLYFEGKPLNFNAGLDMKTDKGNITSDITMDLSGEEIIYNFKVETNNLDLNPVAGVKSNLNLTGDLSGKGFSPKTLQTAIQIDAMNSTIGEISFNDFSIKADGSDGLIKTDVSFSSLETKGRLETNFDFTDSVNTKYDFNISLNGFNIDNFIKESGLTSDLNITLKGDGENFDQDKLNLFAVIEIDSSKLNDIKIDSTTLIADIRSGEENRVINIVSDLADLTITGDYTLLELIDAFAEEASMLSTSIKKKIEQIELPDFSNPGTALIVKDVPEDNSVAISRNINADYLLELKSFELLSLFLGNSEIQVDGEISGKIFSTGDTILVTLQSNINQMRYWNGTDLYYLSGFNLSLEMSDRFSVTTLDDLQVGLNVKSDRIFVGSDIKDLKFNLNFKNKKSDIDFSALVDEHSDIDLTGSMYINSEFVEVMFDKFLIKHNQLDLRNVGDINFNYSKDKFKFNSFTLAHNGGKINLNGEFSLTGDEDLSLNIEKFKVRDLTTNLLNMPAAKSLEGELNFNLALKGHADNPEINLNFVIDSVKVQNINLGSIESNVQYSNKLFDLDLWFIETKNQQLRKSLGLAGNIPIDLSFYSKERLIKGNNVDLTFFADNFDLRFITGFIPGITNLKGQLNGEIKLTGPHENVQTIGELSVGNSSFILEAVNLTYLVNAKINFENDRIILSSFSLRNEPSIRDGGVISASGEILHDNFVISSINMRAGGELKLLDERSKATNPSIFGDITIKTRKDIVFTSTEERSYLNADLILKRGTNITYSPTQSAFSNENDKFVYKYATNYEEDILKKRIDSLITVAKAEKQKIEEEAKIPFDLDLKIEVESEAKMVFVLSREFKQNLTTYLGGNFEYSLINNVPLARGELTLLDGSKLDFIKTFKAEGNVEFLDELDNPYIDVTATYESYYSPDTLRTGANEYDVQVKIKLEGPAKSLTTNFLRDEDNIEIYKRRKNYGQYELDPSKTASDAMFFIIVNKFPEDASLQESNLAVSTAASLAGSIVGSVLNEKLGDVIRSVNVQQVGTETKFSLIGKVEEFRYELGGTSQVFQDLSRANVKIEHPLFFPNFIIKFDRREPPYQSSTYSEMINELGLKYSFVF
jgi:hypothetical protein